MSQLVVFVRHGESISNVRNILSDHKDKYSLTRSGVSQAKKTAKELLKLKFDAIFSSPVLRARQTAAIISNEVSLDVTLDKRLWERHQYNFNESDPHGGLYKFIPGARFESTKSVFERTKDFIDSRNEHSFIAVAHKVQQECIAQEIYGFDDITGFPFKPAYASMTIVEKTSRKMKIIASGFPELPDSVMNRIPQKFRA